MYVEVVFIVVYTKNLSFRYQNFGMNATIRGIELAFVHNICYYLDSDAMVMHTAYTTVMGARHGQYKARHYPCTA